MKNYQAVIGLEIHAELATKTKLFCSCQNDPFHAPEPNLYICPVCLGLPGSLPVMNRQAVEWAALIGLAMGCKIGFSEDRRQKTEDSDKVRLPLSVLRHLTKWDRKNYFYPDLPKGYQISQYDLPLAHQGGLEVRSGKEEARRIEITRIHLEEDTAKLLHPPGVNYSLMDFNRAGVPLLELVTEPVIKTAEEASAFAQRYQAILRELKIATADMEKGGMRVEANVSVRRKQRTENREQKLGTKVEVKNLNSFRSVRKAIDYETRRQIEVLERGESIRQETRGWDENKQQTFVSRVKETAADYRYFPEPDLPPVTIQRTENRPAWPAGREQKTEAGIDLGQLRQQLPELPASRQERYQADLGLAAHDAERLVRDPERLAYFEAVDPTNPRTAQLIAKWILNDLPDTAIPPANLAELAELVTGGTVTSKLAKTLFPKMRLSGQSARAILKSEGLSVVRDQTAIDQIVSQVLADQPQAVADYRAGKSQVLGFIIGQVMAKTKGQADPQVIRLAIERQIKELS